jgi:hypothetical protein
LCYLQETGKTHWEGSHELAELECWEGVKARARDVEVKISPNRVTLVQMREEALLDCRSAFFTDTNVQAEFVIEEVSPIPWGGVASDIPEVVKFLKESEATSPGEDGFIDSLRVSRDDLLRVLAFDDLCRIGVLSAIEQFLPSEKLGYLARKVRDLLRTKSHKCLISHLRASKE